MISVLLSSVAGMGSAFVGNRIYPIKGGADVSPPTPEEVKRATAEANKLTHLAADKAAKLAAAESYQINKAKNETPKEVSDSEPDEDSVVSPTVEPEKQESKLELEDSKEPSVTTEEPAKEVPNSTEEDLDKNSDKLATAIMDGFKMDADFAENVVSFIKTPVTSWKQIASTPSELKQKFMKTLTHPNLNKCPDALKNICKIVSVKYSNMKDFIEEKGYTPFGDETADALNVLSSNS